MKPLREPADIHPDDEGTRLVLIHTDSRGRKDSRYSFYFGTFSVSTPLEFPDETGLEYLTT